MIVRTIAYAIVAIVLGVPFGDEFWGVYYAGAASALIAELIIGRISKGAA